MTTEEQRKYLEKLIEEQLTVLSDESEGTQAVSMDFINACSPDYIEMEEPEMTMSEIMHMMHMDDPNIFPDQAARSGNDDGRQKPGDGTLGENHAGDDDIKHGGENDEYDKNGNKKPDYDEDEHQKESGGGSGDSDEGGRTPSSDNGEDYGEPDNGWPGADRSIIDKEREPKFPDDFKYPEGTDLDRVVDAIINDDEVGSINAVIEFARPSIRDEKGVDYTLNVKPGQEINIDTIIATAHIDGKEK